MNNPLADFRRQVPIGSMRISWLVHEDRTGTKDAFGAVVYQQWPRPSGTVCFQHADQRHTIGVNRWELRLDHAVTCELCAINRLLRGEAVLEDVAGFEQYVVELEAYRHKRMAPAGTHRVLARQVLDAAGRDWGIEAVDGLLRAVQVAALHPDRAVELAGALRTLLTHEGPAERSAPDAPTGREAAPEPPPATRVLEQPGEVLAPMSTELHPRRSLRGGPR